MSTSLIQIRNRNKIEIKKIYPPISKNELILTSKNSILGISINTPSASGNKILAIFDFLARHNLTTVNILIADSVYHYTAMIRHQCNIEKGKQIAEEESKKLTHEYMNLISTDKRFRHLNFIYTSQIEEWKDFQAIYEKIWNLFLSLPEFRKLAEAFSSLYLNRALLPKTQITKEQEKWVYEYLIKELAILALLNNKGFNMHLYAGDLEILYQIISINEPYLHELFKNFTLVSLRIKRKK